MSARRFFRVLLVMAFVLAPVAGAHGDEHAEDDLQGTDLMLGSVAGLADGSLVIVPTIEGALPCDGQGGARVPLAEASRARLVANATHVLAAFEQEAGFVAFAVDTGEAVRTLILMQEYAVALLAGRAAVLDSPAPPRSRAALLGVPTLLDHARGAGHGGASHALEGEGIQLDYDLEPARSLACAEHGHGHVGLLLLRADLPTLGGDRLARAILLSDTEPLFLPRPLDASTTIAKLDLLLLAPGDDASEVARAVAPEPSFADAVALVIVGAALVVSARLGAKL